MLTQLIYVSRSNIRPDSPLLFEEVAEILSTSFQRNQAADISGLLMYCGGYFCQLLEGEDVAIERCMVRITADTRHGDLKVMCRRPIKFRNIPKYPMGCAGIEKELDPLITESFEAPDWDDPEQAAPLILFALFSRVPTTDVVVKDPGQLWEEIKRENDQFCLVQRAISF